MGNSAMTLNDEDGLPDLWGKAAPDTGYYLGNMHQYLCQAPFQKVHSNRSINLLASLWR